MVVIFTALSLAAAYGWLAGFVRQTNGDLSFHWRWLVLVWAVVGFASAVYFWRKIWPPEDQPDSTRKSVTKGSIALLLPGLWWLLFPLRSQSGQHFWSVVEGLSIAAIVLTIGAFMLIRLAKAFEEDGTADPDSNVASNKDLKK